MTIIFAILLFSLLIFVHELGHFLVAKACGVQVNEFSMFMGPAIWKKKKKGETLYAIRCIPIGGYCAMEGEDTESENPRAFRSAAWWKRLLILVAGSAMNFLIGFMIMVILYLPVQQLLIPEIASFDVGNTISGEVGLQVGDRFLEVDGEKIYVQSDVSQFLAMNPGDTHDLVVERDGQVVVLNDFVMEKHIFGQETTPRYGFSFVIKDASLGDRLSYSFNTCVNVVRYVRLSLQMIFTGQAGLKDISGPVGIVQQMNDVMNNSESAMDAALDLLYFGAFIAINLGVMNLLPVPALDGGRVVSLLLTTAIEAIMRKKLNPKYEGYIHGAGMIVLLLLIAVIMFKDIFVIIMG